MQSLEFCGNVVCILRIGFNGVDEVYTGLIKALELVAWSRTELEDFAVSGADKRGNTGGVFKGDEAVGYAQELACVGSGVGDREVTMCNEEFCCGGVSNSLDVCKCDESVLAKEFFEDMVVRCF